MQNTIKIDGFQWSAEDVRQHLNEVLSFLQIENEPTSDGREYLEDKTLNELAEHFTNMVFFASRKVVARRRGDSICVGYYSNQAPGFVAYFLTTSHEKAVRAANKLNADYNARLKAEAERGEIDKVIL
jgi:methyltransferase-like protein